MILESPTLEFLLVVMLLVAVLFLCIPYSYVLLSLVCGVVEDLIEAIHPRRGKGPMRISAKARDFDNARNVLAVASPPLQPFPRRSLRLAPLAAVLNKLHN